MSYSIIGAGNVGRALAKAFARKGMDVTLASRRAPEDLASLTRETGPTVSAKTLQEALKADVILLAVPFRNYKAVAAAAETWQGKLVIDATNAYGVPVEEFGDRPSSAIIAESLPGASLVKAFNHLPAKILEQDPQVGNSRRVLFLASNSEDAIPKIAELVEKLGYAPVSLGRLDQGGLLVQARGNSWAPLIFQDLLKQDR